MLRFLAKKFKLHHEGIHEEARLGFLFNFVSSYDYIRLNNELLSQANSLFGWKGRIKSMILYWSKFDQESQSWQKKVKSWLRMVKSMTVLSYDKQYEKYTAKTIFTDKIAWIRFKTTIEKSSTLNRISRAKRL